MKTARFEDRRLAFTSEVNGVFTLKGAKISATKEKMDESGNVTSAPFVFATCKQTSGKGRSLFIGAGDLQVTAIEAGLKGDRLPFPNVEMNSDVDPESIKANENFTFVVAKGKLLVK